jgi:hypothetical protein
MLSSLKESQFEEYKLKRRRGKFMRAFSFLVLAALAGICFTVATPAANAQVAVDVGVAPDCPYGYYDVAPYECAPAGYYGPEWFNGGVFIGVGPWFHGPDNFRGKVDNHFDAHRSYKGKLPERGEKADESKRVDSAHFKGNEERDGRGHATSGKH